VVALDQGGRQFLAGGEELLLDRTGFGLERSHVGSSSWVVMKQNRPVPQPQPGHEPVSVHSTCGQLAYSRFWGTAVSTLRRAAMALSNHLLVRLVWATARGSVL